MPKNILENLELKLIQTREEQKEKFETAEKDFNENFKPLFEYIFEKDTLGFKKMLGSFFILENVEGNSRQESLDKAYIKTLEHIPLESEKKESLVQSLKKLETKKSFIDENLSLEMKINKDPNYPILEDLIQSGDITNSDLAEISLRYRDGDNIIESTHFLPIEKRDIITKNFYELNNTHSSERIENFENDFQQEIAQSEQIQKFPGVTKFVGRYYTKLKLKNKVETKAERLKRLFKIAFLKLYRLKFSGIDIDKIMQKINSYSDFDDFINLLLKYFEVLKENPDLQEAYAILDEIDAAENLINEAEGNKDKEIQTENNLVETSKIIEEIEDGLTKKDVDKLLDDTTDLVGDKFIQRPNTGVLVESQENTTEDSDSEDTISEKDLEVQFHELQDQLFELEEEKRKHFLEGNYDKIDEINEQLITLGVKADKLKKSLGIGLDDETRYN